MSSDWWVTGESGSGAAATIPRKTSTSGHLPGRVSRSSQRKKAARSSGTVDSSSAYETIHPGAVYLHGGESYVVTNLDVQARTAYVERTDVNYYTTPAGRTSVDVEEDLEARDLGSEKAGAGRVKAHFGDVSVTSAVTHFWRKRLFSDTVIDKTPLDLPTVTLDTQGAWITLPDELTNKLIGLGFDLPGTIHAIEHAAIGLLPLLALCDRNDIGGVSHPGHPDTQGLAAIFIYDGHAGGVGLARAAYDQIEDLLAATLRAMEDCRCDDGCPSCIQSPKCGNNNEPLDKAGAIFALRAMIGD